MKIGKTVVRKVIYFCVLCAALLVSCYTPYASEDELNKNYTYKRFIGADNLRRFYERHGALPYTYWAEDNRYRLDVKFVGTEMVEVSTADTPAQVFLVTKHRGKRSHYMTLDRIINIEYHDDECDDISADTAVSHVDDAQVQRVGSTLSRNWKRHPRFRSLPVDVRVGDTIFVSEDMRVLSINGHFLTCDRRVLIHSVVMHNEWNRRYNDSYFKLLRSTIKHMQKQSNK